MIIKIGNREIGEDNPCFIIAEGCDNHLGNIETAKEMIIQAKLAGVDAIKFQHHLPYEEMLPDVPQSTNFNIPLYEFLQKYSLTLNQHIELMEFANKAGIQYLCTPFSLKAACELESIGIDAFKIGSGEMTDIPTLVKIAKFKKPMIVSTGMSSYEEIDRTYNALVKEDTPLALMNCVSEYPPVYEDINLGVIKVMKERYTKAVIGHSDHTPDIYTCFAAIAFGAKIIEKHVILDIRQPGPDQSVSIDFWDLKNLVDGIRKIEVALGNKKKVHEKESSIREWAFRSLVTKKSLKAGDILTEEVLCSKRPGTGIPSYKIDEVLGMCLKRDIGENELLKYEFIEKR